MVTMGRLELIKESYQCFTNQTYPNKKLLIVVDGYDKDAVKILAKQDKRVSVLHIESTSKTLGELRNISLTYSPSSIICQWDDDDWYAPNRMMDQFLGLKQGKSAVMLTEQLHYFRDTAEVGWSVDKSGIEGTILFDKRCGIRYPEKRLGEDTVLKGELYKRQLISLIPGGISYCRTYHGENAWGRKHHVERIKALGKPNLKREHLLEAAKLYKWRDDWKPISKNT